MVTYPLVDMNFIFENINFKSTSGYVLLCLLIYKHTNNDIFADFPKISDHFAKISEDFSKIVPKATRTFPNIFRRFSKITEDFRGGTDDVSNIHIWVLFKRLCSYSRGNLAYGWRAGNLNWPIWIQQAGKKSSALTSSKQVRKGFEIRQLFSLEMALNIHEKGFTFS